MAKNLAPILAIIFAYLGGLNANLAAYTGTCTMSDAGHLFGIILSLPFYAAALTLIGFVAPPGAARLSTLLLGPLLLWQAAFALNLSIRILIFGATACEVLWGAPYGPDGHEIAYATLWLTAGIGLPALLALTLWLRRTRSPD